MAKQEVIRAARQNAIHNLIVDGDTTSTALVAPVASPTKPTAGAIIALVHEPLYRFIFGATSADGHTVSYQIIGWYKCKMPSGVRDTWIGVVLEKGLYTAGTLVIAGITTGFFAHTITATVSTSTSVVSTLANHVAMLTIDTHNAKFLQLITERGTTGTAAKAYAWAIPADFSR